MHRASLALPLFVCLLLLAGCDDPPPMRDAGPADAGSEIDATTGTVLDELPVEGSFAIPELEGDAYVVRTEMDVPHVYARSRTDMMRVFGFVSARDRFFQIDMTRRLSSGRITEILGEPALTTDIESRMSGGGYIADLYLEGMTAEEAAEADAFAEGINAYIEQVRQGNLPPPSEYAIAAPLVGARSPVEMMKSFTRRDVVSCGVTILYGTSFETGDQRRSRDLLAVPTLFEGAPDRALREAGLMQDIMARVAPPNDSSSAAGWGLERGGSGGGSGGGGEPSPGHTPRFDPALFPEVGSMERLERHLSRFDRRFGRDRFEGYGSNVWAVAGSRTTDGASLLSSDGHLQLSVPALFLQIGLDTELLGPADQATRQIGATIAGLPAVGVGTNGRIAWGQTAYFSDVTDWYSEELVLDASGAPMASRFGGAERPLRRVEESYEVANIPLLDSVGRTETLARFETFDGRWITSIEGREVSADEPLGPGETRVNLMGDWIVPGDTDGDGVVSAISFYYGPFDGGTLLRAFRMFGMANSVEDFRQAMRHFIAYGGSMMASDRDGDVLYSAYHAVPRRDYLPHEGDDPSRPWIAGADPRFLLDGTRYGAWSLPLTADGVVDEAACPTDGSEPYRCAVPFDDWPQALSPDRGYVHHANNDPGHIATDNDLFNDPYYIGGPWIEGYRAERIEARLQAAIAANRASLEEMMDIQGDHHSNLGEEWVPLLLETIGAARAAALGAPPAGSPEARMAARFSARQADFEEVEARITAWRDAGFPTPSGVSTFYHTPASEDAASSVATTLFNGWFPRFVRGVLDDERIPSGLSPAVTGDTFRMGTIKLLVGGRGPGNPSGLGSYNPATEESVFFDDVGTPEVESSQEIALRAVEEMIDFYRADPSERGVGGYGTADWDQWLWGLRHYVHFDSLLGDFLGGDPMFSFLVERFSITPARLPLAEGLTDSDPRFELPGFPRPGDQFDIDAANPGLDGVTFDHGSGPVFRMAVALSPDGVRGRNIIPGGQSGLTDSDHFDDQVQLWLANDTVPMRFLPEEVVAGATSRERFAPSL